MTGRCVISQVRARGDVVNGHSSARGCFLVAIVVVLLLQKPWAGLRSAPIGRYPCFTGRYFCSFSAGTPWFSLNTHVRCLACCVGSVKSWWMTRSFVVGNVRNATFSVAGFAWDRRAGATDRWDACWAVVLRLIAGNRSDAFGRPSSFPRRSFPASFGGRSFRAVPP